MGGVEDGPVSMVSRVDGWVEVGDGGWVVGVDEATSVGVMGTIVGRGESSAPPINPQADSSIRLINISTFEVESLRSEQEISESAKIAKLREGKISKTWRFLAFLRGFFRPAWFRLGSASGFVRVRLINMSKNIVRMMVSFTLPPGLDMLLDI
jgi:hypothetical protein